MYYPSIEARVLGTDSWLVSMYGTTALIICPSNWPRQMLYSWLVSMQALMPPGVFCPSGRLGQLMYPGSRQLPLNGQDRCCTLAQDSWLYPSTAVWVPYSVPQVGQGPRQLLYPGSRQLAGIQALYFLGILSLR